MSADNSSAIELGAAGNAAKTKVRRVNVVCSPGEVVCPNIGDGLQCSCNGICGVDPSICMPPIDGVRKRRVKRSEADQ
mgnify:CR=1 FL=1